MRTLLLLLIFSITTSCSKPSHTKGEVPSVAAEKASYKPRLGDRNLIASALRNVYKSSDGLGADDAAVETLLTNLILSRRQFFGGSCQYYDSASCSTGDRDGDALAPSLSTSSSPREAYRVRACLALNALNGAALAAVTRAGLTLSSACDAAAAAKIYQLFYPARTAPTDVVNHLVDMHARQTVKYNSTEAWKLLLLSLCLAPGWQQI